MKKNKRQLDYKTQPLSKHKKETCSCSTPCVPIFTNENSQQLAKNGYTVVKNVIPKELCERGKQEIQDYLQSWNPNIGINNDWKMTDLPVGTIHGINRNHAHMKTHWEIRAHPHVMRVFSKIHGTCPCQLITSLDSWNFYSAAKSSKCGFWAHTDQKTEYPNLMVQGLVCLEDCSGDNDGGLVVWDKSHRIHAGYFKEKNISLKDNWYKYPEEDTHLIENDGSRWLSNNDPEKCSKVPMKRIRVKAEQGDLVLWDSRTAHQNQPPQKGGRDRYVMYVCEADCNLLTEKDIKVKQKAWETLGMTSHWPVSFVKMFPATPRFYAKSLKEYYEEKHKPPERPELTEVQKRLLGYRYFKNCQC